MFRNIRRVLIISLVLFLAAGMMACTEKKNSDNTSNVKDGLAFSAPLRFQAVSSNVDTSSLKIDVELVTNDANRVASLHTMSPIQYNAGIIRGEVRNIAAGNYNMRMRYYLYDGPTEIDVVVTDFQPISVSATSATPVTFTEAMNNYPDRDQDGASNLHEIDKKTNWVDKDNYPPPDDPFLTPLIQDLNVNLTWKSVGINNADPTTYTVYAADVPLTSANYLSVATAYPNSTSPFVSPVLLTGQGPYYFVVRGTNFQGDGDVSAPVSVNPQGFIPDDFTIVSGDQIATFTWANSSLDATSKMNLFMQNSPGVKKLGSARLDGWMAHFNITNGFVHTRLKFPKHPYYFALSAQSSANENSAITTEVVIQPTLPVGQSPTGVGLHFTANGNVALIWDEIPGRDYNIYRANTAAVLAGIDTTRNGAFFLAQDIASSPFDLRKNAIDITKENYFVIASFASGDTVASADSAIVGFIPQGTLSAPINMVAELVDVNVTNNTGTAELNWTPVAGAISYNLYMGPAAIINLDTFSETGENMVHRDIPVASYSHPSIASKPATFFAVTAVNAFGESQLSDNDSTIERLPVNIPSTGTSYLNTIAAIDKLNVNLVVNQTNVDPSVQVTSLTLANGDPILAATVLEGTTVNLNVTLPRDGGEFLVAGNGAGSAAGTAAYYAAVDPSSQRDTFFKWKEINGIAFLDPAIGAEVKYEVPDAQVLFFNGRDHNLARVISMKRNAGNIAFYADHFASLEDAASIDSNNFTSRLKETVAIEFSYPASTPKNDRDNVRYLKFFAFDPNGNRVNKINLDGRGERFLPEACVSCHAGDATTFVDNPPANKPNPSVYPKQGNVNARFNPFDVEAFTFLESSPVFNQATQEPQFRLMNEAIIEAYGASKQKTVVYDSVLAGVAGTTINDFCDAANVTGAARCIDQTNGNTRQAATVIFQEGVVDKITVSIDSIEHPNLSDLLVNLISPAGTVISLGRISATIGVLYNDVSSREMSSLYGEDSVGRWQLQILDTATGPTSTTTPVLTGWTLNLTLKPPAVELIEAWYGGVGLPSTTQDGTRVPRGWRTIASVAKYYIDNPGVVDGPIELYRKVIKKSCRVCHLQRGSSGSILDFATWDNFNKDAGSLEKNQRWLNRIEHEVYVEGNMPRALPVFTGFWLSEQPQILAKFLRPGSATQVPASPAPISGFKGAGNPYLHSGRIHNVPNDGAILGGTADAPVRLGAAVEHYTQDDAGNFIGSYNWWLASKPALSSPLLDITLANSQYPMLAPDVPGEYIIKGTVTVNNITSNISEERVYVHTDPIVKNPLSFSDIVKDILKPGCGRCHRSGGPADHTGYLVDRNMFSLDNDGNDATAGIPGIYDLIVNRDRRIDPRTNKAANSRLLQKPSMFGATMHGGRIRPGFDIEAKAKPPGTSENYQKILDWINLRPVNGVPPPD